MPLCLGTPIAGRVARTQVGILHNVAKVPYQMDYQPPRRVKGAAAKSWHRMWHQRLPAPKNGQPCMLPTLHPE